MSTILLIILILLLIGALPTWPYSSGWGYWPSGGLGLILLIIIILALTGHLLSWGSVGWLCFNRLCACQSSRQPRRMGAPDGNSCEAVKDLQSNPWAGAWLRMPCAIHGEAV